MKKYLFLFCFLPFFSNGQTTLPRIAGHVGIVHPIVSFSSEGTETNFGSSYRVGFPIAIKMLKTEKVGFSFEIIPAIKSELGVSKV